MNEKMGGRVPIDVLLKRKNNKYKYGSKKNY
jgi:hypothetical protein